MILSPENNKEKQQNNPKRRKFSKKKRRLISLSVICSLMVFLIVSLLISNFAIKINTFTLQNDSISSSVRLAIMSDLHRREFGDNNEKLLKKIEEQKPDLILLTGDIISSDDTKDNDFKYLHHLVFSLKKIAPVYFSIGNHERANPYKTTICKFVRSAGGTVLDSEYTDIYINGNHIRVGGLSYYRTWDEDASRFLTGFSKVSDDVFTLLLCHFPEFYLWGIKEYPIDLVVSGHTHGGMVKLPLIGPLYAPEQGWFPDYAAGLYSMKNGHLAVTTGLASSPEYMPRIFNRPEIMIIDLE